MEMRTTGVPALTRSAPGPRAQAASTHAASTPAAASSDRTLAVAEIHRPEMAVSHPRVSHTGRAPLRVHQGLAVAIPAGQPLLDDLAGGERCAAAERDVLADRPPAI